MRCRTTSGTLSRLGLSTVAIIAMLLGAIGASAQDTSLLDEAIALHDAGEYGRAFEIFKPLAEAGVIKAQNRLAHMYYWGEGTAKNPEMHHEWAMRSAMLGDPYGQFDVATAYFSGRLFPADPEVGMVWLNKSVEGGDSYALHGLGMAYIHGDGVARDVERGTALVAQAAANGDPNAQMTYGSLLLFGENVTPQSRRDGAKWVRRAAQQRNVAAQYLLSELSLADTRGPNLVEAAMWLMLSAKGGCVAANPALLSLLLAMSDEQEAAAIDRAAEWDTTRAPKNPHDHRRGLPMCDPVPAIEALR